MIGLWSMIVIWILLVDRKASASSWSRFDLKWYSTFLCNMEAVYELGASKVKARKYPCNVHGKYPCLKIHSLKNTRMDIHGLWI